MDTARFRVAAELAFRTRGAETDLDRVIGKMRGLEKLTGTSSTWVGRLTRNLVAVGAGYVGINALAGGFRSLVAGAVQYQTELEGMKISTAAVMGAVENIPFDEAREKASHIFDELNTDAIKSVATTQQLVGIFNEIVGPLEGAGQTAEQVRNMTSQLVTTATALNVPLDQAASDMSRMMSGAAGARLPLFRMLHATGAIAEDAKHWNHLTSAERISKMNAALERFASASDAYGHSFAGVTSTFTDILDHIKGDLMGPAFRVLTDHLGAINDSIIKNMPRIRAVMTQVGKKLAVGVEWAFNRIQDGMAWIGEHWDTIVSKTQEAISAVRALLPELRAAARAWAAFSVARMAISAGAGAGANVLGIARAVSAGLVGTGATAGAGAAGGPAAGAGTLATALATAGPAMLAFAAAAAAVGGAVLLVHDHFEQLRHIVGAILPDFGGETGFLSTLRQLGEAAIALGRPLLKIFTLITLPVWGPMAAALAGAALGAAWLLKGLASLVSGPTGLIAFGNAVNDAVDEFVTTVLEGIGHIVDVIRLTLDPAGFARDLSGRTMDMARSAQMQAAVEAAQAPLVSYLKTRNDPNAPGGPGTRASTINDFRGSRINVTQTFREADPDRIAVDLIEGLMEQAERRIASGYVAPLTR